MTSSERRSSWIATGAAFLVLGGLGALIWWLQPGDEAANPWPIDAERRIAGTLAGLATDDLQINPRLDAREVSLRHISGGKEPTSSNRTQVVADVAWTPGPDSVLPVGSQSSRVSLELEWVEGKFDIVGAAALSEPVPLWLLGPVEVEDHEDALILAVGDRVDSDGANSDGANSDGAELAAAVTRGLAALEQFDARLAGGSRPVIVAPDSEAGFAALLGRPVDQDSSVAAITTNLGTDAGPVIVVAPTEYAHMDGRARHIVMAHELVHAQSAAVGTRAPLWVVEGYADLVALADDDVPMELSAGAAVARGDVGIPVDEEFSSGEHRGAAYEAAWLAWVVLEREFGPDVAGDIYFDALAEADPAPALARHTGWSLEQLSAAWSDLLGSLG